MFLAGCEMSMLHTITYTLHCPDVTQSLLSHRAPFMTKKTMYSAKCESTFKAPAPL